MFLSDRDPILLTPGPLTTSLTTRTAMLRDHGSWDDRFNAITARVRSALLDVIDAHDQHECIPLQGSGTFAVEAAVGTLVPRDGHLLVCVNGAYGQRLVRLARMLGRQVSVFEAEDNERIEPSRLAQFLASTPGVTHVALIHCETSTGIENPLREIATVVADHGCGLIVDAMSSFGALPISAAEIPFDALIAASGKCIEGPPGMGFVFVRRELLEPSAGNSTSLSLDLHDQWQYMHKTGQWRFTPPTHIVAALDAALAQFNAQGGQAARLARYSYNCRTLISEMVALGFQPYLGASIQAPIIVTFHAPRDANWDFRRFYLNVRDKGFILYPGKLTRVETFRVGCIGAVGAEEIRLAVRAIADTLAAMDVQDLSPARNRV